MEGLDDAGEVEVGDDLVFMFESGDLGAAGVFCPKGFEDAGCAILADGSVEYALGACVDDFCGLVAWQMGQQRHGDRGF